MAVQIASVLRRVRNGGGRGASAMPPSNPPRRMICGDARASPAGPVLTPQAPTSAADPRRV